MYSKCLENFEHTPSKNPKTAWKQQARFQRACRRVFSRNTVIPGIPDDLLPFVPDVPLYSNRKRIIAPGTPDYLVKLRQLKRDYDMDKPVKYNKAPKSSDSKSSSIISNTPPLVIKDKILTIPEDLLPFVPDGPLYTKDFNLLTPGTSRYLNRLRDLKKAHEKGIYVESQKNSYLIRDLTYYQDIYHEQMSKLAMSVKELDTPTLDTGSTSSKEFPSLKRKTLSPDDASNPDA
ncbi:unnamed protein product [Rhizophagus irregularis]|nr:unnamed protein product [Rhizophagus irregularis]